MRLHRTPLKMLETATNTAQLRYIQRLYDCHL